MAVNCCAQLADLYRNCETDTIINYFAKSSESHKPMAEHLAFICVGKIYHAEESVEENLSVYL